MVAELHVRTIFEEAWSEINHHIRYHYQVDNHILGNYLEIFNRLVDSADEMGSFIKLLDGELKRTKEKHRVEMTEKDRIITELNNKIDGLGIGTKEKDDLLHMISNLIKMEQPKLTHAAKQKLLTTR
ncbi:MAG: RelA/SpoT domain protein [Firmicutes bacterium]|nr:RelA/SpoT domain protein [Bacillota bacterium]